MKPSSIIVTGGAGYIGSHACKALAQAGYTPVTYDNLSRGHRWAVRWGPLVEGDLADQTRLEQCIAHYQPLAVLHFAAWAYVGESVADPYGYYVNNVGGTLALLQAMQRSAVNTLIFSSSCATYGIPESVPITEQAPQVPINPYGASKLMIERILRDAESAYGLRHIALRYFNAAGADPDGDIGEWHEPEPHLIPLVLDAALGIRPHITVFGNDYPTPDGTCIRDYVHVTDLVAAHVLALDWLLSGGPSLALNLGNATGFSVNEVIAAASTLTGRTIPTQIAPRRAGDPAVLIGDARQAQQTLHWQPRFADLNTQLRHAWHWHQRRRTGQ